MSHSLTVRHEGSSVEGVKMSARDDAVHSYGKMGYNCSQAIIHGYADAVRMYEDTALAAVGHLGGGGKDGICGAIRSAQFIARFIQCGDQNEALDCTTYDDEIRDMAREFAERIGADACRVIKGRDGGKLIASCHQCVAVAVDILDKYLTRHGYANRLR